MPLTLVQNYRLCSQPTPLPCKGSCLVQFRSHPWTSGTPAGAWLKGNFLMLQAGHRSGVQRAGHCLLVTLGKSPDCCMELRPCVLSCAFSGSCPWPGPAKAQSLLCEQMDASTDVCASHLPLRVDNNSYLEELYQTLE